MSEGDGREIKKQKNIFDAIITDSPPKLMSHTKSQVQRAQRTSHKMKDNIWASFSNYRKSKLEKHSCSVKVRGKFG